MLWVGMEGRLHQLDVSSGASSLVTRVVGGRLTSVQVDWDLALVWRWEPDGTTARQGWVVVPLTTPSTESWPHPERPHELGPIVRGRVLTAPID